MTPADTATDTTPAVEDHEPARRPHPTPRDYVNVALILGVLTALEVSTYFLDFGPIGVPLLIVLMIIKFLLVAGWFMHLRVDSRLYGRLLGTGLGFAVVLYTITLVVFVFDQAPMN